MISCAEARKILYDLETTASRDSSTTEPGTMIALAKAHAMTCMACSEYFDRERGFIAVLRDRVNALTSPMPEFILASVLAGISNARVQEYSQSSGTRKRDVLYYLKKFFRRL